MTDAEIAEITVVILAGGRGARFDHESHVTPKPLIKVAGEPIIQHIIDGFVAQGFKRFTVATGYLGNQVLDYFAEGNNCYRPCLGGVEFISPSRDVSIVVVDTGLDSHTGERLWRLRPHLKSTFILTYGDGLSDVDMRSVINFHRTLDYNASPDHPVQLPLVTLTAVNPPGRFGVLRFSGTYHQYVRTFAEKDGVEWINGGFMVCEPAFIDEYLEDAQFMVYQLESQALPALAKDWKLRGYRHHGYWQCMDTRRDLETIEDDVKLANGLLPWRRDMMWPEDNEGI